MFACEVQSHQFDKLAHHPARVEQFLVEAIIILVLGVRRVAEHFDKSGVAVEFVRPVPGPSMPIVHLFARNAVENRLRCHDGVSFAFS